MQSDGTGIGTQYYQGKKGQDGNLGFVMIFYKVKPTRYSLTVNTPKSILNSKNFTLGTLGKLNNTKITATNSNVAYYVDPNDSTKNISVNYTLTNYNPFNNVCKGIFKDPTASGFNFFDNAESQWVYYKFTAPKNTLIYFNLYDGNTNYLLDNDNINNVLGTNNKKYKVVNAFNNRVFQYFINLLYVTDGGSGGDGSKTTGGGGGGSSGRVVKTNTYFTGFSGENKPSQKLFWFTLAKPVNKNKTANTDDTGANCVLKYKDYGNNRTGNLLHNITGQYFIVNDGNDANTYDGADGGDGTNTRTTIPGAISDDYGIAPGGGGGGYQKQDSGSHGSTNSNAYSYYTSRSSRSPGYISIDIGDNTCSCNVAQGGNGASGNKNGYPGNKSYLLIFFKVTTSTL
jgi:hypothetical protein